MILPELYKEYQYKRGYNSVAIRIPKYQKDRAAQISIIHGFLLRYEDGWLHVATPNLFVSCNSLTSITLPTYFGASAKHFSKVDAIKVIDEIDFLLNPERLYL